MFLDRVDAGRRLGVLVRVALDGAPAGCGPIVVAGLPRGGIPVAVEVAGALGTPWDVILVRKIGLPWHRELAMGAVGEDDVVVVNDDIVRSQRVTPEQFAEIERAERSALQLRSSLLRAGRPSRPLAGRTVVVVDDGLATGATARAACQVARARGAARVVLAVPVAPRGWETDLADAADDYVAVETPARFRAVGEHYRDFGAVSDREVMALLERAADDRSRCGDTGEPDG